MRCGSIPVTSRPSTRTEPARARLRPTTALQRVVLPMPLRPTTASTPEASSSETPCSARLSP